MKPETIYVFKNGSIHLELAEVGENKVKAVSMNGGVGYLDKRDVMTGLAERIELPADIRKWDPKVRAVWLKQRLGEMRHYLAGNPNRHNSLKISIQSSDVNKYQEKISSEEPNILSLIRRTHSVLMDKTQFNEEDRKLARSRRVKQRLARAKQEKIGALIEKKSKHPKYKRKTDDYPEVPKSWPIPYGGYNLGFIYATIGVRYQGRTFLEWYEVEGQFIDCDPLEYYNHWMGTKENLNLRMGTGKGIFYFRYYVEGKHAKILPWNWPYSRLARTDEEKIAIFGEPRKKDGLCFLRWYDQVANLPHCGKHGSNPVNCGKCAELAYSSWWKGKS